MDANHSYESFRQDLTKFSEKLDNIYYALQGNSLTKDGGLVQRVADLEDEKVKLTDRIEIIEKKAIRSSVQLGLMWASWLTILAAALTLIVQFIKK